MQTNIQKLSLLELREQWQKIWGFPPHNRLGRPMLEKSLRYKLWEISSNGPLPEQQRKLESLIRGYKTNKAGLEHKVLRFKSGTRLIRIYNGIKHSVIITDNGFEYAGSNWSSLSQIARHITGTHWNGWAFFGVKKATRGTSHEK